MEISVRVYKPGSVDSQIVQSRLEGHYLVIGPDDALDVHDLELAVGGSTEDRIKILSKSTGIMLVCDDRKLLDALAKILPNDTNMGKHVASTRSHLEKRQSHAKKYWFIVFGSIAAIAAILWFSVDWAAEALVMQVDPKMETKIGEMLSERQAQLPPADADMAKRAEKVGKKLVAQISNNPYKYRFFLKDDSSVNACAYPGGTVFINTGLMEKASDDELAGVLGHEIGHVVHQDVLREVAHNAGSMTCLALLAGAGMRDADKVITALSMARRLESLQFGRAQESNADITGVDLAVKAGYDGHGLLNFFKRLQSDPQSADNKYLALLSTHPMNTERMAAIEAELKRLNKNR